MVIQLFHSRLSLDSQQDSRMILVERIQDERSSSTNGLDTIESIVG